MPFLSIRVIKTICSTHHRAEIHTQFWLENLIGRNPFACFSAGAEDTKLNLTKSKFDNPYIYKERDKESTFSGRGSHLTCG